MAVWTVTILDVKQPGLTDISIYWKLDVDGAPYVTDTTHFTSSEINEAGPTTQEKRAYCQAKITGKAQTYKDTKTQADYLEGTEGSSWEV